MGKKASYGKIKVRNKNGVIEVQIGAVKGLFADMGYSGKLLFQTTKNVFKEAKHVAKAGVLSAASFEKALVSGVKKTNGTVIEASKKVAKRMLK